MKPQLNNTDLYFFSGGGEMGSLIRAKDWSKSPLGNPAEWPESLQTTVAIMLNNPFGMYIAWGDEYTQLYNDGYRPILGAAKHPAALGISTRETFKEVWHIIGDMFDGVMKGKAVGFPDFMLPLERNGYVEECYFDFAYSPIKKNDGKVGGVLVTVIETTDKKKAVDALKASEERFRAMADNIPNLAWMANADGWIYWYNKKWYDYTGTTPDQMEGWGWQSVHHPKELPLVLKNWKRSLETEEPFEMTFPLRGADGAFRFFLTRVLPVRNNDGKIYKWFGSSTDITERIEAAGKLKESEQNLRNTITQAPVAMCILKGDDFVVDLANTLMIELWGKQPEHVLGKPIFDGLPEAKDQGLEALVEGVYKTGKTFLAYGRPVNLPRNGVIETTYINFVYEAYRGESGAITGVIAVAVDVTEQVVANQKIESEVIKRTSELAETNHKLQKSNAELAQFAYIASHDLQEPLRKISNFANLLDNKLTTVDEQSKKYIQKIQVSTERMTTLIRDVLAYSELVKVQENFEIINLNKVIESILPDFELAIEEKNAAIVVDTLPEIEAISLQMSQLFSNLLSNSLKYASTDKKLAIKISASLLNKNEKKEASLDPSIAFCKIQFTDNGIGFSKEHVDKVFQIFQRLHGKSEYAGTGIGLSICKKIAQNHQGDINALGSSGKGAIFNVILPLQQQ